MKGIKFAVLAMGVLIVAGLIVVVVTIVGRLSSTKESVPPGDITLPLPAGCSLADAWGEQGRIYLRLEGEGPDCQQVLVIEGGQIATRYKLVTE